MQFLRRHVRDTVKPEDVMTKEDIDEALIDIEAMFKEEEMPVEDDPEPAPEQPSE